MVTAMNRTTALLGALCGALVTASLMALMYLASELADMPFVPFDLFDWQARVLPGDLVTFGIDLMIDTLLLVGMSVADTAKTAEQILALLQFLGQGVVAGAVFFVVLDRWLGRAGLVAGLVLGAVLVVLITPVSIVMEGSQASAWAAAVWLLVVFPMWGAALGWAFTRLVPAKAAVPAVEGEAQPGRAMSRRQFLIRLGAATATITVVGAGIGQVLDRATRRRTREGARRLDAGHAQECGPRAFPQRRRPARPGSRHPTGIYRR